MPREVTAPHGTGASCQSGGWKYLEKHLLSCRLYEMIKSREWRKKESGLQQALLTAALAEGLWLLLRLSAPSQRWSCVWLFWFSLRLFLQAVGCSN